ncbi:hypothetical protein K439DRAFT_1614095 [Ramaria rubella]|nr:hypothetical protein K439DRAFT_1614095 [Ramaria rubella]
MSHIGATYIATTTTTTTTTTRSRIAQFMGLPSSDSSSKGSPIMNEDEWYIPYNGPIEPPPQQFPRRRPRGNTFGAPEVSTQAQDEQWDQDEEDNTFGYRGLRPRAASNARSFASSSSHSYSHSHAHSLSNGQSGPKSYFGGVGGGGGIGEAPVHIAASTRDRASTFSTRPFSAYSTRDRNSIDGEMVETQPTKRGSIASFLTFGGVRKSSISINTTTNINTARNAQTSQPQVFTPTQSTTLSPESGSPIVFNFPTRRRGNEDKHRHTPFHPHPQSQLQRNGTFGSIEQKNREERLVVDRGDLMGGQRGTGKDGDRQRKGINEDHAGVNVDVVPVSASTVGASGSSSGHLEYLPEPRTRRDEHTWYEEDEDLFGEEERQERRQAEQGQRFKRPPQPPPVAGFRKLSHSASQPSLAASFRGPQQQLHSHPRPQTQNQYPHPYAQVFSNSYQPSSPSPHTGVEARSVDEVAAHIVTTTTTTTTHIPLPLYPQSQSHPRPHPHPAYLHAQAHAQAHTRTVSPAAIAAAFDANPLRHGASSRSLKPPKSGGVRASISTPNLRSLFGMGDNCGAEKGPKKRRTGEKSSPAKLIKTQYAAETWCDALMFPRPRFRAHVISPPGSPTEMLGISPRARTLSRAEAVKPGVGRDVVSNVRSPSPPPRPLSPPMAPRHRFLSTGSSRQSPKPPVTSPVSKSSPAPPSPPPSVVLTPAEETMRRVIAEGERRDQERQQWQELASSSFQNGRSRSLSRTRLRKKSIGAGDKPRAKVQHDAARRPHTSEDRTHSHHQGISVARSLTVGLTTLAAEAFRQPTPTISTISHGGATESNAHSRNTSESMGHRHTHARNTSWGKVALKQLCAPEEEQFSDAVLTPEEEKKQEKLEGALIRGGTEKMRVWGRREEAEEADVQFVDIVPVPMEEGKGKEKEKLVETRAQKLDVEDVSNRSHSQNSNVSDSLSVPGVGIALSTPPKPSSYVDLPDLSTHPYAQPSTSRIHQELMPVSAAYAGPHLTSPGYNRHRFPTELHLEPNPRPAERRMYTALQSGAVRHVSTPETVQVPAEWQQGPSIPSPGPGPSAYAYENIAANDKRESTLGVEEVLMSTAFQRGGAESSGYGDVDGFEKPPLSPQRAPSPPRPMAAPSHPVATPPRPAAMTGRVRQIPAALKAESGIPSLSHTATTAEQTDVTEPEPEVVQHVFREVSTALSSPSSQDTDSFYMGVRPLGSLDDLEPFRDLFYKPGRTGSDPAHGRTPSSEGRRMLGSRDTGIFWGEDRIRSNEGLNGLRNLTRKLSEDSQGQVLNRIQEDRKNVRSPSLPGLNDDSVQIDTPLRAEYEEGQDFPEDIHSSRASSIIEPDLEETLRMGIVSLSVPEHTQPTEYRQSTALSIGETEGDETLQPDRNTILTTGSSHGIPRTVDDLLRTSFATTSSSASHMTNLIGDFPSPPALENQAAATAPTLQPYVGEFTSGSSSQRPSLGAEDISEL